MLERQHGLCLTPGCRRPPAHCHHVLPAWRFPHLEQVEENLVAACPGCHDEHERAARRFAVGWLPACALALARDEGPAAEAYVARTYPEGGTAVPGGTRDVEVRRLTK